MHQAQHARRTVLKRVVSEIRELTYQGQNVRRTPKNHIWLLAPAVIILALVLVLISNPFGSGGTSLADFSNFVDQPKHTISHHHKARPDTWSSSSWRLHPPRSSKVVSPFPYYYTVRSGDTLSDLAKKIYGRANAWTLIYFKNRSRIKDPSSISTGTRLKIVALHGNPPAPPPVPKASTAPTPSQSPYQPSSPSYTSVSGVGGAFGACVRAAENGGSYSWATGNGGGAYQFLYSTWVAYGGDPSLYGNAGPAYQDQIFMNAINAGGQSNWSLYDGC